MDDDLNISAALAAVFDLVRDVNRRLDARSLSSSDAASVLSAVRQLDAVLAILPDADDAIDPRAAALLEERVAARAARDWARSDAIRDELLALGIAVEDTRDGQRWRRAEVHHVSPKPRPDRPERREPNARAKGGHSGGPHPRHGPGRPAPGGPGSGDGSADGWTRRASREGLDPAPSQGQPAGRPPVGPRNRPAGRPSGAASHGPRDGGFRPTRPRTRGQAPVGPFDSRSPRDERPPFDERPAFGSRPVSRSWDPGAARPGRPSHPASRPFQGPAHGPRGGADQRGGASFGDGQRDPPPSPWAERPGAVARSLVRDAPNVAAASRARGRRRRRPASVDSCAASTRRRPRVEAGVSGGPRIGEVRIAARRRRIARRSGRRTTERGSSRRSRRPSRSAPMRSSSPAGGPWRRPSRPGGPRSGCS